MVLVAEKKGERHKARAICSKTSFPPIFSCFFFTCPFSCSISVVEANAQSRTTWAVGPKIALRFSLSLSLCVSARARPDVRVHFQTVPAEWVWRGRPDHGHGDVSDGDSVEMVLLSPTLTASLPSEESEREREEIQMFLLFSLFPTGSHVCVAATAAAVAPAAAIAAFSFFLQLLFPTAVKSCSCCLSRGGGRHRRRRRRRVAFGHALSRGGGEGGGERLHSSTLLLLLLLLPVLRESERQQQAEPSQNNRHFARRGTRPRRLRTKRFGWESSGPRAKSLGKKGKNWARRRKKLGLCVRQQRLCNIDWPDCDVMASPTFSSFPSLCPGLEMQWKCWHFPNVDGKFPCFFTPGIPSRPEIPVSFQVFFANFSRARESFVGLSLLS